MTPSIDAHRQYEAAALVALQQEEDAYRGAKRSSSKVDPLTGELAKTEPAHQPFDLQTLNAENQVIQGAQGYRIAVHAFELWNCGDQCDIFVKDGVNGIALTGALINFPAQSGKTLPWSDTAWFTLSPGNAFVIRAENGAAIRITGFVKYRLLERGPS